MNAGYYESKIGKEITTKQLNSNTYVILIPIDY